MGVPTGEARVWHVNVDGTGDTVTIQAAIDSAAQGDAVIVASGLYRENLELFKDIFVLGLPEHEAIVDGDLRGRVLRMNAGTVQGLVLRNGWTGGSGGGVRLDSGGSTVLRSNIIESNRAGFDNDSGFGGGVYAVSQGDALIESNVIRNNFAGFSGGGVFCQGVILRNNTITGNDGHRGGGAVCAEGECVIEGNLIIGNIASSTPGIYSIGFNTIIRNNTIAGNRVLGGSPPGMAIYIAYSGALILNNLIVHNGRDSGTRASAVYCSNSHLECNDIWGNGVDIPEGSGNTGQNFSLDPEFCAMDPVASFSFLLQEDSPCASRNDPIGGACGLVGAMPVGCGSVSVQQRTWGEIKRLYGGMISKE